VIKEWKERHVNVADSIKQQYQSGATLNMMAMMDMQETLIFD
jgi:hypothetical protein